MPSSRALDPVRPKARRRTPSSPIQSVWRCSWSSTSRRVQGQAPAPDLNLRNQRRVVDLFLAAVQSGDVAALVAVLDPDIVLRSTTFSKLGLSNEVVLVNGNIGVLARLPNGRVLSVIGFTIANGKVIEMDILADPDGVSRLDLSALDR
jgi:RNA polymerase sigma-70 factor (ECF subfamily)